MKKATFKFAAVLFLSLLIFPALIFADDRAEPFQPGETIDPGAESSGACGPLDDNCFPVFATTTDFSVENNLGVGTSSPWKDFSVDGDISLTGGLFDSNNSSGDSGYILQSTGSGISWVATSTLGLGGGSGWTTTGADIFYNGGKVGIGTSSLGNETLAVIASSTSTTGNPQGSYFELTATPTANTNNWNRGLISSLTLSGTNNFNGSVNTSGYFDTYIDSTGTMYGAQALYPVINNVGLTSLTNLEGIHGYIESDSGAVTNMTGFTADMYVGGGTVSNSRVIWLHDNSKYSSGSINNDYGLYIDNISSGTNNYAIYSEGGNSYFGGNVGVGTSSPYKKLSVAGDLALTGAIFDSLNSGGANGMVLQTTGTGIKWVATSTLGLPVSQWTTSGSSIYYTGGNIGIGTTSPYSMLSVAGQIVGRNFISTSTTATSSIAGAFAVGTSTPSGNSLFTIGTSTPLFTLLQNSGYIGIGNSNPAVKLEISGGSAGSEFIGLRIKNDSTQTVNSTAGIEFWGSNNAGPTAGGSAKIAGITEKSTSGDRRTGLGLYTSNQATDANAVERVRIDAYGNVGIASTTPLGKLSVVQTGSYTDNTTNYAGYFSNTALSFGSSNNLNKYGMYIASTGTFTGGTGTANKNYGLYVASVTGGDENYGAVFAGGNVGVGTTSPWKTFSISGTASFSGLSASGGSDNYLCLSSNNEVTTGASCPGSSERFKHDIETLSSNLEEVMKLRPVTFEYNDVEGTRVGFIAEEINVIDPRLVFYDEDGTTPRGVRYQDFVPLLAGAIQEQQKQISGLSDWIGPTTTPEESEDFVSGLFTSLKQWMGDAKNGIVDFFANRIHTETLCVGSKEDETCITKDQLDNLLNSNQVSVNPPAVTQETVGNNQTSTSTTEEVDETPSIEATTTAAIDTNISDESEVSENESEIPLETTPETSVETNINEIQ